MRILNGALFVVTGLLCHFVYMLLVGAMLGMTTPTYSLSSLFIAPVVVIGPSLLILVGVATLFVGIRRSILCLTTSLFLIGWLAAWSFPRSSWRDATWLLIEPMAVSFLIASIILILLKKRWIAAVVGSVASAPFFIYANGNLVYSLYFGNRIFTRNEIWFVAPMVLIVLSLVLAIRERTA